MEEFFFKFSNKSNLISEENFQKKEIHFVEYDKIIKDETTFRLTGILKNIQEQNAYFNYLVII